MSDFSNVDASANTAALVSYLDATDASLAAMKSYMAAAAKRAAPRGFVLDLGCGVGHDLARLQQLGLTALGIDASEVMLNTARGRIGEEVPLVRGDAASLPFKDASIGACRVERVLQHVREPREVVAELARVFKPDGFLAVFEPDYETFRVKTDDPADCSIPARLLRARHPAIGRDVEVLLETHGFRIDDVITESSRGYQFERLPINAELVIARAVADARIDAEAARSWIAEQRARSAAGTFEARWDKILVIAHRRD